MYQHIVFYIDGTLINNEEAILHSLQECFVETMGEGISFEPIEVSLGSPERIRLSGLFFF